MSDIYAVVQNGVVTNLVVWDGKSGNAANLLI